METEHTYQFSVNRTLWCILILLAVLFFVWLAAEGMTVDTTGLLPFLLIYIMFLALSIFYRYVRHDFRLFLFGQLAAQWLTAAAIIGGLSYVTARLNYPLLDKDLVAIDRMLFFDWRHYIGWVNEHPLLAKIFSASYVTSGPQMIVIIALLFLYNHMGHLQRFLLAFIVTGCLTVIFAALFPAMGGYIYYGIDLSQYENLHPVAAWLHEVPLLSMRHHATDVLTFPMQGLVTFPSFHSTLSVILVYAAWPVAWLRYPLILLNIVILFSTPVDGGHYLSDIIGGVLIALASIRFIEVRFRPKPYVPKWEDWR